MAKKKLNRTEFRIKLIKRIEKIDKKIGWTGSHGIEYMTEIKLEEFVNNYEHQHGDK